MGFSSLAMDGLAISHDHRDSVRASVDNAPFLVGTTGSVDIKRPSLGGRWRWPVSHGFPAQTECPRAERDHR